METLVNRTNRPVHQMKILHSVFCARSCRMPGHGPRWRNFKICGRLFVRNGHVEVRPGVNGNLAEGGMWSRERSPVTTTWHLQRREAQHVLTIRPARHAPNDAVCQPTLQFVCDRSGPDSAPAPDAGFPSMSAVHNSVKMRKHDHHSQTRFSRLPRQP